MINNSEFGLCGICVLISCSAPLAIGELRGGGKEEGSCRPCEDLLPVWSHLISSDGLNATTKVEMLKKVSVARDKSEQRGIDFCSNGAQLLVVLPVLVESSSLREAAKVGAVRAILNATVAIGQVGTGDSCEGVQALMSAVQESVNGEELSMEESVTGLKVIGKSASKYRTSNVPLCHRCEWLGQVLRGGLLDSELTIEDRMTAAEAVFSAVRFRQQETHDDVVIGYAMATGLEEFALCLIDASLKVDSISDEEGKRGDGLGETRKVPRYQHWLRLVFAVPDYFFQTRVLRADVVGEGSDVFEDYDRVCSQPIWEPLSDKAMEEKGFGVKSGRDERGGKPLHRAAYMDEVAAVEELLANRHSVLSLDDKQRTPLHYAAYRGNMAMVYRLVQAGAKISIPDEKGLTALHYAAINNHVSTVKLLASLAKKRGGSVSQEDYQGWTALHYAASRGSYESANVLSELMSVLAKNSQGATAAHLALGCGHDKTFEMLFIKMRDRYPKHYREADYNGRSMLHYATRSCNTDLVSYVLNEVGIYRGEPDSFDKTSMHYAIDYRCKAVVKFLFKDGIGFSYGYLVAAFINLDWDMVCLLYGKAIEKHCEIELVKGVAYAGLVPGALIRQAHAGGRLGDTVNFIKEHIFFPLGARLSTMISATKLDLLPGAVVQAGRAMKSQIPGPMRAAVGLGERVTGAAMEHLTYTLVFLAGIPHVLGLDQALNGAILFLPTVVDGTLRLFLPRLRWVGGTRGRIGGGVVGGLVLIWYGMGDYEVDA